MICRWCWHGADDHSLAGAMDPKFCKQPECKCSGWTRLMDEAEDFVSEDFKLRAAMKQLDEEFPDAEGGHWTIEWVDDVPFKVWRGD